MKAELWDTNLMYLKQILFLVIILNIMDLNIMILLTQTMVCKPQWKGLHNMPNEIYPDLVCKTSEDH